MRRSMRAVAVGLTVLLLLAAAARPVPAQVGRPTGATQGRVIGAATSTGRPATPTGCRCRGSATATGGTSTGAPAPPGAPRRRVRRRLGLRADGPHQAGGEPARDHGLPGRRLAVPGGPGRAAGRAGAGQTERWAYVWSGRQDAPYGDGCRRAAGDGPVRRRAHHHGLVPACSNPPPPPGRPPDAGPALRPGGAAARPEPARAQRGVRPFRRRPARGGLRVSDGGSHEQPGPVLRPLGRRPGLHRQPRHRHVLPGHRDGPAARDDRCAGPSGALLPRARGRQAAVCEAGATAADRQPRRLPTPARPRGRGWCEPLETARPVWIARYITSNTQGTAVTYGPEPTRVTRAWVY